MKKFEDDTMELMEMVAENSHQNVAKPFRRGSMLTWKLIDAKSVEMSMLLERIEKMVEVQKIFLDRLNIWNGFEGLMPITLQEASSCANCSRLDHVEVDYPIMAVQG